MGFHLTINSRDRLAQSDKDLREALDGAGVIKQTMCLSVSE
jgi:hypothetical protein